MNACVGPLRPPRMDWVYRQSPVETFNGRRGNVCLTLPDIIWAGGAPVFSPVFLGAPSSQMSPPIGDDSTRFATTEWVLAEIDLLAPTQGPPGPQGPPGMGLLFLGSVPTPSALPTDATVGDMYVTLDTGTLWVWDGSHWVSMQPAPAGPQGAVGPAGPQGAAGVNGTNGTNGAQGPQGIPGTGFQVLGSVTDPADLPPTGNHPGDVYIDSTTGQGYAWTGTAWVPFDLGAQGLTGATGPTGPAGPQGLTGSAGAPVTVGGVGPAGPAGSQGPQGATGATGPSSGVTTWNGRAGAVTMSATDITNAGGLANPNVALTGVPTAPTAAPGTSTTQLATTAFVTANAGAGGKWTQIATQTVGHVLAVAFTGLSQAYSDLMIVGLNIGLDLSEGGALNMQVSTNNGALYSDIGAFSVAGGSTGTPANFNIIYNGYSQTNGIVSSNSIVGTTLTPSPSLNWTAGSGLPLSTAMSITAGGCNALRFAMSDGATLLTGGGTITIYAR